MYFTLTLLHIPCAVSVCSPCVGHCYNFMRRLIQVTVATLSLLVIVFKKCITDSCSDSCSWLEITNYFWNTVFNLFLKTSYIYIFCIHFIIFRVCLNFFSFFFSIFPSSTIRTYVCIIHQYHSALFFLLLGLPVVGRV